MVICENLLRIFIVTNSDNLKILEEMKHTILAIDDERSIRILLDNFLSQDYPNEIQAITCRDGKLCLSDTGFDAHIFPRPDGHYCSLVCKKGKKLLFASSKDTNQY